MSVALGRKIIVHGLSKGLPRPMEENEKWNELDSISWPQCYDQPHCQLIYSHCIHSKRAPTIIVSCLLWCIQPRFKCDRFSYSSCRTVLGGLISAGASWQWIFFVSGIVFGVVSLISIFVLKFTPEQVKCLLNKLITHDAYACIEIQIHCFCQTCYVIFFVLHTDGRFVLIHLWSVAL